MSKQENQNKIYVVTRAINQYDQDGHYFVTAFTEKPTVKQLQKAIQCSKEYATWLLETNGGGKNVEYEWYYITIQESGQPYNRDFSGNILNT